MNNIEYLRELAESPALHNGEWVSFEWAIEHFSSSCEAEFVSTFTPAMVLSMLEQIIALQSFVECIINKHK